MRGPEASIRPPPRLGKSIIFARTDRRGARTRDRCAPTNIVRHNQEGPRMKKLVLTLVAAGAALFSAALSADPFIHRDLGYDPIKDFVPVTRVGSFTLMLVVNPTQPIRSVKELVDYAKA